VSDNGAPFSLNKFMYNIVGIGELLWDMLPAGKQMGGAPGNFAFHASQCGINSVLVSAVGNDDLGNELMVSIKRKNLNVLSRCVPKPTGTVNIVLDDRGVPNYTIVEDVAWDYIPFSEDLRVLAEKTDAVCFGSLAQRNAVSRNTILRFVDAMKTDTMKIFDINFRQHFYSREIIETSMQKATVLKLNDEEMRVLIDLLNLQGKDESEICSSMMSRYGLSIVILTCGERGSSIFGKHEISVLATPNVQVADTVGAGDAFTAAFCVSYLKHKNIALAHELAVKVSAFVCTQHGAMPKYTDELMRILQSAV